MSSSLRRGSLAAIAFSIASLAACGAGSNAQTLEIKPDNAATSVDDIKIQNAVVITPPDPESTDPTAVSATVFNAGRTDQTLDSIALEGVNEPATLKPAKGSGSVTIPAGGSVILGGKGNASAVLTDSGEAFRDGDVQPVIFTFSETGDVSLRAFVVPAESYFTKWGPSSIPSPSATASASATKSSTGSPKPAKPAKPASGTPTASATASKPAG